MTIYGIDANSKSVAVVWWDGLQYHSRHIKVWQRWAIEAAPWFRKSLKRLFDSTNLYADDHVFLEAPVVAGARNIQSSLKQAYINGIIQEVVGSYGVTAVHVDIWTWKKNSTGSGGASKEEVAEAIKAHDPAFYASIEGDQDRIDAAGITLHGRTVVGAVEN